MCRTGVDNEGHAALSTLSAHAARGGDRPGGGLGRLSDRARGPSGRTTPPSASTTPRSRTSSRVPGRSSAVQNRGLGGTPPRLGRRGHGRLAHAPARPRRLGQQPEAEEPGARQGAGPRLARAEHHDLRHAVARAQRDAGGPDPRADHVGPAPLPRQRLRASKALHNQGVRVILSCRGSRSTTRATRATGATLSFHADLVYEAYAFTRGKCSPRRRRRRTPLPAHALDGAR